MSGRALLAAMTAGALVLGGCGTPWRGGQVAPVAPVGEATLQLQPTPPNGQAPVLAPAPTIRTGARVDAPVHGIGPVRTGRTFAVVPVAVATLPLTPSVPNGVTAVAPIVPNGGTALTSAAAPVPAQGTAVAAAPAAASASPNPIVVRPLPPRPAGSGASSAVTYALATTNPVGRQVYPRNAGGPYNCGTYLSPSDAQEAFLAAGGPEDDRLGLDPDGDGYACSWDPTPFRRAVQP